MPALSPDGTTIAFISDRDGNRDLWLMNVDGSDPINVTTAMENVYALFPEWSPDSRHLLFQSSDLSHNQTSHDLWLVSLENRKLQRIITDMPFANPRWSPDGKSIVFALYENYENIDKSSIWVMDSNGKNPKQLISGDRNTSPEWSPDGKSITYISNNGNQTQLILIEIDTNETRILSSNTVIGYAWAPRSHLIIYEALEPNNYFYTNIWLVQTDKASEFKLTDKPIPLVNDLAWSPDENKILFWSSCGDSVKVTDLWVLDLKQLSLVNLTSCQQSFNSSPSWFPDSEHILFRSNRSGTPSIWVMSADGKDAVDLINPK